MQMLYGGEYPGDVGQLAGHLAAAVNAAGYATVGEKEIDANGDA